MAMLELAGLRKSFGETEVLRQIDLSLASGEMLVIVGASDQSIIVNDPDANGTAGKYVHYPRKDFAAAWSSAGNTALVLA